MIPHYAPVGAHVSDSDLSAAKTIKVDPKANAILVQAVTQNVRLKLNGAAAAGGGLCDCRGGCAAVDPDWQRQYQRDRRNRIRHA